MAPQQVEAEREHDHRHETGDCRLEAAEPPDLQAEDDERGHAGQQRGNPHGQSEDHVQAEGRADELGQIGRHRDRLGLQPQQHHDAERQPVAADLAEYTKDIKGNGPLQAQIETSMGTFHCELFADKAPMTVANFIGLATGKKAWQDPKSGQAQVGKPFFEGLTFHRVIPGFMIQGGDPMGVGVGGPGYQFEDEVNNGLVMKPGTLAMANAGPGTNGSQFFIMEGSRPMLEGGYSIFGQCSDPDVVSKITHGQVAPGADAAV